MNTPSDKTFIYLECGTVTACGLDSDGHTYCWGMDKADMFEEMNNSNFEVSFSLLAVNDQPVSQELSLFDPISVGYKHACAIKTDGSIHCAGEDHNNAAMAGLEADSQNPFVSVTSAAHAVCVLRE